MSAVRPASSQAPREADAFPMAAVPAPYLQKALEGSDAHPAEAEPQTAGITTAIVLSYVESRGGRAAVERVLELSGLLGREGELRDESTWWTYIQKQALMHAVAHVLDDPQATRRAGAYALEAGVGTTLKAALRAFGSPELAYANVARSNHKFSRNSRMEVLMVGDGYATLSYRQVVDVRNTRVDCLYNQGLLGVLPQLFGLAPARVTHTQCALDGADACVYDVRWERRSRLARWSPTVTAAGVAGRARRRGGHVRAGGRAGARRWRWAAPRRWAASAVVATAAPPRDLEAELDTRVRSADSLRTSLRQLAGELDLEALMTLIGRRRRARRVSADAAALLLEEEGALVVQRASGLGAKRPAGAGGLARRACRHRDDGVQLDRRRGRRAGAGAGAGGPAAADLAVLRSAARRSGPARDAGGAVAHRDTFLPQDVDWIEAYAAQAAVALSNARLYARQQEMARRDELTGLGNRRAFDEALDAEVLRFTRAQRGVQRRAAGPGQASRRVNDSDGHAAGDELLREVARALEGAGRATDSVFRLGGDEFAVRDDRRPAPRSAVAALTRTAAAAAACDRRVGASVGIATCPTDGLVKDDLLRVADARLYEAKPPRRGAARRARTSSPSRLPSAAGPRAGTPAS